MSSFASLIHKKEAVIPQEGHNYSKDGRIVAIEILVAGKRRTKGTGMQKRRNNQRISYPEGRRHPSSSLLCREVFGRGRDVFFRWNGRIKTGEKVQSLKRVLS
jgi:hypothetical protein